jgi:hypothetical protein
MESPGFKIPFSRNREALPIQNFCASLIERSQQGHLGLRMVLHRWLTTCSATAALGFTLFACGSSTTDPDGAGGVSDSGGSGGIVGTGGASTGGAAPTGGASLGGSGPEEASDIRGKITVGYQGWFTASTDGAEVDWWHITTGGTPSPTDIFLKSWPDTTEYDKTYATGFPNLGNGGPSVLFSSYDASTVDKQIQWMKDYDIDTLALQRFGDYRQTGEVRNIVTGHVKTAAEKYGRKFYIMYDITGWDTFDTDIPADWQDHLIDELHVLDSSAYAYQDGKPVVCIWGLGYTGNHPGTAEVQLGVVQFFKDKGFYVIGGVGNDWRVADGTRWAKAGYESVYEALDAISPWMVGVIGDDNGSDSNRTTYNEGDVQWCHERGIDYQPCVLPGDLQEGQRKHGDFMWHQFANMIEIDSDAIYISMYDEYNESNQIAKTAATAADTPTGAKSFTTLDEDGTACSSDYYLRLTGDGGRMLKGEMEFTFTRPTSPMP